MEKEEVTKYQIGDTLYRVDVKISKEFKPSFDVIEHKIVAVHKSIKSTEQGDELLNIQYETTYQGNYRANFYGTSEKNIKEFIRRIESSKEIGSSSYKSRVKWGMSGSYHFGSTSEVEKFKYKIKDVCGLSSEEYYKVKNSFIKLEASIANREKLLNKSYRELNNLKKLLDEYKKSEV